MSPDLAGSIEPLDPRHDVSGFVCTPMPYLASELRTYWEASPFVVGQRVLVAVNDRQVTGFMALTNADLKVPDEVTPLWSLFVSSLAVTDSRRNSVDARDLVIRARESMGPAEDYWGRPYEAIIIQPLTSEQLTEAVIRRMGFRPMVDGFWGIRLRPPLR